MKPQFSNGLQPTPEPQRSGDALSRLWYLTALAIGATTAAAVVACGGGQASTAAPVAGPAPAPAPTPVPPTTTPPLPTSPIK